MEYDVILRKLIKSSNPEEWQQYLQDNEFCDFLSQYQDENGNNVYHLLFKISKTSNKLISSMEIAQLCLDKNIPVLKYNSEGKSPSELATGKTFFATVLQKREFHEQQANAE